jgi:hypothetical protein
MTSDLEALVVAAYVFADEYRVAARPGPAAKVADAELVALAACQAAMGISSDRQFLGLVGYRLPGWFPHLPSQSQYNRRLRGLTGLLTIVQQRLARLLDSGGPRVADGTLIGVANYAGCAQRSEFAGTAAYGYCAAKSEYIWASGLCCARIGAGCPSPTPGCRPTSTSTSRCSTSSKQARPCSPTKASGAAPTTSG